MKRPRYCLLTNDVETTSIWHNQLRDSTGYRVLEEGLPRLLSLYGDRGIKSTFFVTGYIAKLLPRLVRLIVESGHELGSHSFSHRDEDALDVVPQRVVVRQLSDSKKLLEDIAGLEVTSFRAPALRVRPGIAADLLRCGYRVDSSVASQRFDMFMSFGGIKKLRWLTAPRTPYRTRLDDIFRKGSSELVEVPLSATILPYVGSTMRIFPTLTRFQQWPLAIEAGISGKQIVFDIHPNELIDESEEPQVSNRRAAGVLSHILKDRLRTRLKTRNLGTAAERLYLDQITFFEQRGFTFRTIKDYCFEAGLVPS